MKISLYLDEDVMSDDLLTALRARSVDVISVRETQRQGYSDEEQIEYATLQGRVIYTFNTKDYVVLHNMFMEQGHAHAGIIVAEQRHRYSIGEHLRRLLAILSEKSAEEMRNQLLYISNWG